MKFDVATSIPMDSKVRMVCNIAPVMNLDSVLSTYSVKRRKPVIDPVIMLKIHLFCYSEGIYSCRKIEGFAQMTPEHIFCSKGVNHIEYCGGYRL
jgi:transposase